MKLGVTKQKPTKEEKLPLGKKYNFEKGKYKNSHILFSFEALDFSNKYFNLDGTCYRWAQTMMEKLKEISEQEKNAVISGQVRSIRFHNHDTAKFDPPYHLKDSEFYQIRFGKSKGGIHGVLVENIFYVIWLDPQHNMYPDEKYGGIKTIKPPETCCTDKDKTIESLQGKIKLLEDENKAFEDLFSEVASGNEQ